MEKKLFEEPEMMIISFENVDVITSSEDETEII